MRLPTSRDVFLSFYQADLYTFQIPAGKQFEAPQEYRIAHNFQTNTSKHSFPPLEKEMPKKWKTTKTGIELFLMNKYVLYICTIREKSSHPPIISAQYTASIEHFDILKF